MLKLTKTGIGLLTKQYRSVLRKCLLLNLGLLLGFISTSYAWFDVSHYENIATGEDCGNNIFCAGSWHGGSYFGREGYEDILSLALKTRLKEKGISVSFGTSFTSEQLIQATRDIMFGTYIRVGDWTPTSKTFNGKSYSSNLTTYSSTYSTTTSVGKNLEALDFAVIKAQADVDYINDVTFNYYYTFRVDERDEVIEFAKELRSNKKEMSSLDFMPIKSSSDLRINLIKAEDPLTFSTKTRDDSLDLREVCHA
jgi:hypothetical protein